MEQNTDNKVAKGNTKKTDSTAIRFEKAFMRTLAKLVDKANKKQFGRKIKPRMILENLLELADDKLIEKVVNKCQEEALSINDRKEIFIKENLTKFKGNKEDFEQKMMEVFQGYLSQNPI